MNKKSVKVILDQVSKEVEAIEDTKTVSIVNKLINLVEMLVDENERLKKENQSLKDEVNRLKGEQGKPDIKPKNRNNNSDHSSENERPAIVLGHFVAFCLNWEVNVLVEAPRPTPKPGH